MKIIHRPGTSHQNADELSILATYDREADLAIILTADDDFHQTLREALPSNSRFSKIYAEIQNQTSRFFSNESESQTVYQSYRLNSKTGLLYFVNKPDPDRLFIPAKLHQKISQFAHEYHRHEGIAKSLNRIRRCAYIFKLRKALQTYIESCPACQLSKPHRQLQMQKNLQILKMEEMTAPFIQIHKKVAMSTPRKKIKHRLIWKV